MNRRRAPLQMIADALGETATPLDALRTLAELHLTLDDLQAVYVRRARAFGSPWREIGAALGVTGEAARQRYGD